MVNVLTSPPAGEGGQMSILINIDQYCSMVNVLTSLPAGEGGQY